MKILLTGSAGQLGRELKRSLACLGELVTYDRNALNIVDTDALRTTVRSVAPDVIVNAAAYTAVDSAEHDPATAVAVNTLAPARLAEEAKQLGALLVHYSTDYVFNGLKATPYGEDDATDPLSTYGRSKRDGENAIAAAGARHLILRTSWVYGLHGANFLKTMLRLGRERNALQVIGDQVGAPTWTRHLADATVALILKRGGAEGLYHVTASGETSWHGYAEAIFSEARRIGLMDSLPSVRRITTEEYPLPAVRPKNSRLDCSRLARDHQLTLPDWRVGLADCLADSRF